MFSDDDMAEMLDACGEDAVVSLAGTTVGTIRVKFRSNPETISPYEDTVDTYSPSFLCRPSDVAALTVDHVFTIRGDDYVFNGPRQTLTSGFAKVPLMKGPTP